MKSLAARISFLVLMLVFLPPAQSAGVERLLAVGDPVPASGRLGMFGLDPTDPDRTVTAVRRVTDDSSLFVLDYAGTALLRYTSGRPEVLLDTSRQVPADGVGLVRLLRVETGGDGTSAVLALRADGTRGIYRLDNSGLTRLAILSDPTVGAELAIGDTGQIAYVAPNAAAIPVLFQTVGNQSIPLLGPGQVVLDGAGKVVVDGAKVERIRDLTSNGAGDLAFHVSLPKQAGKRPQIVVRKTSQGLALVAATGQLVAPERGAVNRSLLTGLGRPLIGPDDTIACRGTGDDFANFFVDGPGRPFQPMLPGVDWNKEDTTFDYDITATGIVALRAALGQSIESALFLVPPTGNPTVVLKAGETIQPAGRPTFGAGDRLFFLAKNFDPKLPRDRNNNVSVGLLRYDPAGTGLVEVAMPGQPVPRKPGSQLLSLTQRPLTSAKMVTFGALFGGTESFPVPTAGLFQVPLGSLLADGVLLATEGDDLPGADRVALLRELSYAADGTLVFSGLMPGAGPLVASAAASATTAGVVRTQSAPATTIAPLLAAGQPLDRPDRRLVAVLGRLTVLGAHRQLLVARFSQDQVPGGGSADSLGEGLFSIGRDGQVQAVAVTGDPAPGLPGARFASFGDTAAYTLSPPAVAADGNVVFKARLKLPDGTVVYGVFEWTGAAVIPVGLTAPSPDNLKLFAADHPPYDLLRWEAGQSGRAYLILRPLGGKLRLLGGLAGNLEPMVAAGTVPTGVSLPTLSDLSDMTLSGAGDLFVTGAAAGVSGIFRVEAQRLTPVAQQGQPLPAQADGTPVPGAAFTSRFTLLPDSRRGILLFRAGLTMASNPAAARQGLFRLGPQGLQTILVEGLGVAGARDVSISTLAGSPASQTANGATVSAVRDKNGSWQILRSRAVAAAGGMTFTTVIVAREGQPLAGAGSARIVSLDPGPVLDRPDGAGPVFTVNEAGEVAFLASDGQRWGIYLFRE